MGIQKTKFFWSFSNISKTSGMQENRGHMFWKSYLKKQLDCFPAQKTP